MTLMVFCCMAPGREKAFTSPLWDFQPCHQLLSSYPSLRPYIVAASYLSPQRYSQIRLNISHPHLRRETVQLGEAGPCPLLQGTWQCLCCQSGCLLVAFGSLHFLCGFCGCFHPPVWSFAEALACQTSRFELVPGHLLGRGSQIPYI